MPSASRASTPAEASEATWPVGAGSRPTVVSWLSTDGGRDGAVPAENGAAIDPVPAVAGSIIDTQEVDQ